MPRRNSSIESLDRALQALEEEVLASSDAEVLKAAPLPDASAKDVERLIVRHIGTAPARSTKSRPVRDRLISHAEARVAYLKALLAGNNGRLSAAFGGQKPLSDDEMEAAMKELAELTGQTARKKRGSSD